MISVIDHNGSSVLYKASRSRIMTNYMTDFPNEPFELNKTNIRYTLEHLAYIDNYETMKLPLIEATVAVDLANFLDHVNCENLTKHVAVLLSKCDPRALCYEANVLYDIEAIYKSSKNIETNR